MREIGLSSEYNKGKWRFIAKKQGGGEGVGGWKIIKRWIILHYTDLSKFLMKTG